MARSRLVERHRAARLCCGQLGQHSALRREPASGFLERMLGTQTKAGLVRTERVLHACSLDAQRDEMSDRGERIEHVWGERPAGEHAENPHEPVFDQERISGE
jgi:hypothetical protein